MAVKSLNPAAPIGIFDSGIGGLTVAHAVAEFLPKEKIIYFGDTEHLPYGDKSEAAIQSFSVKICDFLLEKGVKLILTACNSAASSAGELIKEYVNNRAEVMDVIDPAVDFIAENYQNKTVGLIGTRRTVESGVYSTKIKNKNKNIELKSLATPLLAPMIEDGFIDNDISKHVINTYLSDPKITDIDALFLGCTHYPLIKNKIEEFYAGTVEVPNTSEIVAKELKKRLKTLNLLNPSSERSRPQFFVSDYTASFEKAASAFFGAKVRFQSYPLP